eukprot:6198406-Pleurochrysis_carterae.AAC.1
MTVGDWIYPNVRPPADKLTPCPSVCWLVAPACLSSRLARLDCLKSLASCSAVSMASDWHLNGSVEEESSQCIIMMRYQVSAGICAKRPRREGSSNIGTMEIKDVESHNIPDGSCRLSQYLEGPRAT